MTTSYEAQRGEWVSQSQVVQQGLSWSMNPRYPTVESWGLIIFLGCYFCLLSVSHPQVILPRLWGIFGKPDNHLVVFMYRKIFWASPCINKLQKSPTKSWRLCLCIPLHICTKHRRTASWSQQVRTIHPTECVALVIWNGGLTSLNQLFAKFPFFFVLCKHQFSVSAL